MVKLRIAIQLQNNTYSMVYLVSGLTTCKLKLRYCEKATKFEKKSPALKKILKKLETSKQIGRFVFKFLWPSQNILTLI